MTNTWYLTMALLTGYTLITGLLILRYFKGRISEKVRKLMGIQIYFWQEVLIIGMGLTALTLFLLKWARVVPF